MAVTTSRGPSGKAGEAREPARIPDLPQGPSKLRVFWRQPLGRAGTIALALLVLFVFIGPLLYHRSVVQINVLAFLHPPSAKFPLGTDELGRSVLARLMVGGQMSLEVGFAAALVGMLIGIAYGMISGLLGGWVDVVLMRIVDLLRSIPGLFLLIFLDSILRPSAGLLIGLIAAVSWHGVARLVRGEVLTLKNQLFVEAAIAVGASRTRIVVRHLFPNALGTILVATTFHIADAVLAIAGLSFLGLGLPPPAPNWGAMLASSMNYLPVNAWWLVYPPGLCILLTVLSVNFIGDALNVAFNVQLSRRGGRR